MHLAIVKEVVAKTIGYRVDDVDDRASLLHDLGFSSANMLELVLQLERTLRIEFRDSDLDFENFSTPERIARVVSSYV